MSNEDLHAVMLRADKVDADRQHLVHSAFCHDISAMV